MAILKHRASHNPNYHDFITYVLFQHDSHARPIYDHNHVNLSFRKIRDKEKRQLADK